MANINALTKQKQILLFCAVMAGIVATGAAGWYISTADQRKAQAQAQADEQAKANEPAPDMTGVVNQQFDDKVQQSAITQFQVINKEMKEELQSVRREMAILSKERSHDQQRLATLEAENAELKKNMPNGQVQSQPSAIEPYPTASHMAASAPGDIPPPNQFYPGMGTPPAGQVEYQPMMPMQPLEAIESTSFSYDEDKPNLASKYPYIPSGSFAESIVIEGADTNAAVTGQQNTSPMQLRLTGHVQMPNDHQYDLTGCFVTLEAWGDVSSERAIVRTRGISCKMGNDVIDQKIAGHVSFKGKNGIKGEVVMRNGEILGWAWGAGFVNGIGAGIEKAATPQVGVGATASMGAGDIVKAGIGGGTGQAAKTLSDYYIKRAEQYHPIIPIGAGNEVTLVFQDGFQLETIEEERLRKAANAAKNEATALTDPATVAPLKDLTVGQLLHPMPQ